MNINWYKLLGWLMVTPALLCMLGIVGMCGYWIWTTIHLRYAFLTIVAAVLIVGCGMKGLDILHSSGPKDYVEQDGMN